MLILYQFPISHYCEKIRWALAFKKLEYQTKNLLPGLHALVTKKLSADPSVPILAHDDKIIQNSSDIISYLDTVFPQHLLTPEQDKLRQEALEWERYVDKEIGIHIRRYLYATLLEHPSVVIPFFTQGSAWYGPVLCRMIFPLVRKRMREMMNIKQSTARLSRNRLERAIDKLYSHLQGQKYLVGDRFTRADLAAASLLAPICKPEKYGLDWPRRYPHELEAMIEGNAEKIQWVANLYKEHR